MVRAYTGNTSDVISCGMWCAGVGLQHAPEEGLPERGDALGHASAGRLLLPVAGARPPRQNREGVQVSQAPW